MSGSTLVAEDRDPPVPLREKKNGAQLLAKCAPPSGRGGRHAAYKKMGDLGRSPGALPVENTGRDGISRPGL